MEFRKELEVKKLQQPIQHTDPILLLGSCFSEHMGNNFRAGKFDVLENPHGILFNPISIGKAVLSYIENTPVYADQLFELNETWHSWAHHGSYSHVDKLEAVAQMNHSIQKTHDFLHKAQWVIITLGSAFVYELKEQKTIVANCHKAPADLFTRRLLSLEEVLSSLDTTIHRLKFFNKNIKIIFTISPVRHLKEGMIENNRSKALLIQAVHHVVDKFAGLEYFPAYELVIDDLRDYRFYSEDMVHPNYQATNYVWEKLTKACLDEQSRKLLEVLKKIALAYKHRPFNPGTRQHKKFLADHAERTKVLMQQYPYLDLSRELAYFELGQ